MDVIVDIGKSGSRAILGSGAHRRVHNGAGLSPSRADVSGPLIASQVERLLEESGGARADHVLIGCTHELSAHERRVIVDQVAHFLGHAVVGITDDGTLAHARYLHGPGVLLAVGTGVIAVALSVGGQLARFDGWGPLAGDRGSAFDVGRIALREAYKHVEASAVSGLRRTVEERIGPLDIVNAGALHKDVHWAERVASLAETVCALANEGDDWACQVLDDAVNDLESTTRAAVSFSGVPEVVVTGRFGGALPMRQRLEDRRDLALTFAEDSTVERFSITQILSGPYVQSITTNREI